MTISKPRIVLSVGLHLPSGAIVGTVVGGLNLLVSAVGVGRDALSALRRIAFSFLVSPGVFLLRITKLTNDSLFDRPSDPEAV
jgi:hypothetical protein